MQLDGFKREFSKVLLFALLSLFVLPAGSLWFARHAQAQRDELYLTRIGQDIDRDAQMPSEQKAQAREFFRNHPPSASCRDDAAEVAQYRARMCAPYSELWQYDLAGRVATWALLGGLTVLLAIFAIGAIAFINPGLQYPSFLIGWNLLRIASAAGVVVQGTLLIWLSFWVTAFFFERYFVKLILVAALLAGAAVVSAIVGIFRRPPQDSGVEGEIISESDAPALWAHVRKRAQAVGTAPPDHIIAGIDTNFFVTQSPLRVGEQTLTGRCLFVSLPLLRILDREEADAVLGHELAHFLGGDTARSAALGPKLVQYDHYCQLMYRSGATRAVFHLIYLYRFIFELALRRDSRAREFLADRVAAKLVSGQGIVRSLLKISAYSIYRSQVEGQLFERDARHEGTLGIAGQVAAGLTPYAASAQFAAAMQTANVPHPFDSHPAMRERMQNVGIEIAERDFTDIVTSTPAATWVTDIGTADAIEQRLWAVYEEGFAAAHEQSLAWRYEPANDAERAIVLKYFPPVTFELKKAQRLEISYAGLTLPGDSEPMSWDRVADLNYEDGMGSDVLTVVHPEKGLVGQKKTKVKLPGIKPQRDSLKQLLGHYWQRHNVMRQQQAASLATMGGGETATLKD